MPYEVVFGRSVVLPQDILFGIEGKIPLRDVNTAAQYAQDVKLGLQNTQLSRYPPSTYFQRQNATAVQQEHSIL